MHGRVKVRTTEQEQEAKRKEREEKLKAYRAAISTVFKKREAGELDDEMLNLTSQLLQGNPDIYTMWNIRKEIFQKLKTELSDEELSEKIKHETFLTEQCLRCNPKSYGAWYHRGWIVDLHPNPDWKRELVLCTKFLEMDERNFHCWDYRRLAVDRSKVTEQHEFEFSTVKIHDNFSNYSAWHYRSKLLPKIHPDIDGTFPISPEIHKKELELVQNAAFTDPNDTSAWFYLRWLLGRDSSVKQVVSPCLVWISNNKALVATTHPNIQPPDVFYNNEKLSGTWNSITNHVWLLNNEEWPELSTGELKVSIGDEFIICKPYNNYFWAKKLSYDNRHSDKVLNELKSQLVSCNQLLELEPDSKWTLLALVVLMQAIDSDKYHQDCLNYLDKLITIDTLRAGYFQDLRSKYILEYDVPKILEESINPISIMNLSSKKLTCLYQSHLLILIEIIDLSNNQLTDKSLPALSALQRCIKINLDNNLITSLNNFPINLTKLRVLSVKHNNIMDEVDIITLQLNMNNLSELLFENNPCNIEISQI